MNTTSPSWVPSVLPVIVNFLLSAVKLPSTVNPPVKVASPLEFMPNLSVSLPPLSVNKEIAPNSEAILKYHLCHYVV